MGRSNPRLEFFRIAPGVGPRGGLQQSIEQDRVDESPETDLAIDHDHGNLQAIGAHQVGAGIDIHHVQIQRIAPPGTLENGPGFLAEVTALAGVEHHLPSLRFCLQRSAPEPPQPSRQHFFASEFAPG